MAGGSALGTKLSLLPGSFPWAHPPPRCPASRRPRVEEPGSHGLGTLAGTVFSTHSCLFSVVVLDFEPTA